MTSHEPGWRPDPINVEALRWWDGTRWTGHSVDSNGHPIDPPAQPVRLTRQSRVERNAMNEWQKFLTAVVLLFLVILFINAIKGDDSRSDSIGSGSPAGVVSGVRVQ